MIFSTEDFTPNKVPHSTQAKGSSSLRIDWVKAASVRSSCGESVIALFGADVRAEPALQAGVFLEP